VTAAAAAHAVGVANDGGHVNRRHRRRLQDLLFDGKQRLLQRLAPNAAVAAAAAAAVAGDVAASCLSLSALEGLDKPDAIHANDSLKGRPKIDFGLKKVLESLY